MKYEKTYTLDVQKQWSDAYNDYILKLFRTRVSEGTFLDPVKCKEVDPNKEEDLFFLALEDNNIAPSIIHQVEDLKKRCGEDFGGFDGKTITMTYVPTFGTRYMNDPHTFKVTVLWEEPDIIVIDDSEDAVVIDNYKFIDETDPLERSKYHVFSLDTEDYLAFDFQWLDKNHIYLRSSLDGNNGRDLDNEIVNFDEDSEYPKWFLLNSCDWFIFNELEFQNPDKAAEKFINDVLEARPNE